MSPRSLLARLKRLQARARPRYVIGQNRGRDRKRRQELFSLNLHPGLTDAQIAEKAAFDKFYEKEDRDGRRRSELFYKNLISRHWGGPALTDAERNEYAELQARYPPNPVSPRFRELAAQLGAIARGTAEDGGSSSKPNDSELSMAGQGWMASEVDGATFRPAPDAAKKLKPASPDALSDPELLEQLMSAANDNVVSGEGIEDVGPVRVMLESGVELDDVLYTLRGKVDRRAYPGNRTLTSWSDYWFVKAVAEAYGRRVMLPVITEKLKALGRNKTA